MIMSTARDYIRPECVAAYLPLIRELVAKTRQEDGNCKYTLYQDTENPGCFVLLEFWRDAESLEMHLESAHFQALVPQIQKLQAQPSVVNVYEEVE